nr:hypothetical protein B0A51_09528 [Rachicladosporium sp. CCFEE 5018]
MASVDTPTSRLLLLPAELLNQILLYLLHHPVPPLTALTPPDPPSRFCANVLLTSHRLNTLGTPILYGCNIFSADVSLLASHPSFILSFGPPRRILPSVRHPRLLPLIKRFHLLVRLDTDPRFTAEDARKAFTGVEELEIEVFQSMYDSCDYRVLGLFEGVRGVGRARVGGSVGRGYAEWLEGQMMRDIGDEDVGGGEYVLGEREMGWEVWKGNR